MSIPLGLRSWRHGEFSSAHIHAPYRWRMLGSIPLGLGYCVEVPPNPVLAVRSYDVFGVISFQAVFDADDCGELIEESI